VFQYCKYFILLLFVSFFILKSEQARSQQLPDSIRVFKGKIINQDSLLPIHNAHIISKFNHWGTISNEEGVFKMYVSENDSLLITSVGYRPLILRINDSIIYENDPFTILMQNDTISINEVIIRAFWDYQTFKLIVSKMEPVSLDQFYPNFKGTGLLYKDIHPASFKGPIQALYDVFNKDVRLQRKLIKIRKQYNELMIQMGRLNDTIPAKPEHTLGLPR